METLNTTSEQALRKYVPRMTEAEATEYCSKAFKAYRAEPTFENMTELNWWIDVVNFKAGKQKFEYQYEHSKPIRFETRAQKWS